MWRHNAGFRGVASPSPWLVRASFVTSQPRFPGLLLPHRRMTNPVSFIPWADLRQVHSLFQNKLSAECHLVLPLSISGVCIYIYIYIYIYTYTHTHTHTHTHIYMCVCVFSSYNNSTTTTTTTTITTTTTTTNNNNNNNSSDQ